MMKNKIHSRIKVSENFYLDEFIDPYSFFYTLDNGLSLVDIRIFDFAQTLRNHKESGLRINNWWWYYEKHKLEMPLSVIINNIENNNSLSKWSGLRTPRSSYYSVTSAHSTGKAIDPKGDSKLYFEIVKENAKEFYDLGVRRIEDISITPTWLHGDMLERNTKPNSIRVVDRTKMTEIITW